MNETGSPAAAEASRLRAATSPQGGRLRSLDALRGFDLFWIAGAVELALMFLLAIERLAPKTTNFIATAADGAKVVRRVGSPRFRLPFFSARGNWADPTVGRTFRLDWNRQTRHDAAVKPAFEPVRQLFRQAMRGLHVVGQTRKEVSAMMRAMPRLNGLDRVVQFLRILSALAKSKECHPIASPDFASESNPLHLERMDRVFHFLHGHLQEDLRLVDAARTVNLSEGAFSRFFRSHTGKTFPHLLNELRIGRACRLLTETDKSISEVAYECGFESLTNFNRQFRRIKGVRPREFRKQMQRCLLDPSRANLLPC